MTETIIVNRILPCTILNPISIIHESKSNCLAACLGSFGIGCT